MFSDGLERVRIVCLVVCPYQEKDADTLHARPAVTDVLGKPQPVHSSTPDKPESGEGGFSAHDLRACLLLRQAGVNRGSPVPPVAAVSEGHSVHRSMPAFQRAEAVVAASAVDVSVASVPPLPDAPAPAREM